MKLNIFSFCLFFSSVCLYSEQQETAISDTLKQNSSIVYLHEIASDYPSDQKAFDALLASHPNVVIDFYADWCRPCHVLGNVISSLITSVPHVLFVKVNIEKHGALAKKYNVRSIPSLIFFKDGSKVYAHIGSLTKTQLKRAIDTHF